MYHQTCCRPTKIFSHVPARKLAFPGGTYSPSAFFSSARPGLRSARTCALLVVAGSLAPRPSPLSGGGGLADNGFLNTTGFGLNGSGFNDAAKDATVNPFTFQARPIKCCTQGNSLARISPACSGQYPALIKHDNSIRDGESGINVMGHDTDDSRVERRRKISWLITSVVKGSRPEVGSS